MIYLRIQEAFKIYVIGKYKINQNNMKIKVHKKMILYQKFLKHNLRKQMKKNKNKQINKLLTI